MILCFELILIMDMLQLIIFLFQVIFIFPFHIHLVQYKKYHTQKQWRNKN